LHVGVPHSGAKREVYVFKLGHRGGQVALWRTGLYAMGARQVVRPRPLSLLQLCLSASAGRAAAGGQQRIPQVRRPHAAARLYRRRADSVQLRKMLPTWKFLEPALGLIESGDKTCDARLLDRAVSKQLKTFAGKRCYVLARSASRELVLHVPRYHLYATFGNAYAYHRRDLVPASWCSSDQPEDIQRFYESSFYGRTLPPIADSIVVFEVQVVRVSARHGRIISD